MMEGKIKKIELAHSPYTGLYYMNFDDYNLCFGERLGIIEYLKNILFNNLN